MLVALRVHRGWEAVPRKHPGSESAFCSCLNTHAGQESVRVLRASKRPGGTEAFRLPVARAAALGRSVLWRNDGGTGQRAPARQPDPRGVSVAVPRPSQSRRNGCWRAPFLPRPDALVLGRERKGVRSSSRFVLQRPFCPRRIGLWASIPRLV